MTYSKEAGEVSARYRSAGEAPSVTYPSGTEAAAAPARMLILTHEEWVALWGRHDQCPA